MEVFSLDLLREKLKAAVQQVEVGALYEHYKGGQYRVTGLTIMEDTREPGVLYHEEGHPDVTFARPLASWLEEAVRDTVSVPRFKKL